MSEALPQDANENSLWGAGTITSGNRDDFPFPTEALYRGKWPAVHSAYYDYGTLALQFVSNRW